MTANELVARVISALDEAGIPHMIVGALSSNVFGIERATKDADFVIELGSRSLQPVIERLAPDVMIDTQMTFESVTLSQRYIATHRQTGFTIELFLLGNDPFHLERFSRRVARPFLNVTAFLQTPEDLVVQKLNWYQKIKRPKDIDDVRSVLSVQRGKLDLTRIRSWCDQHGTRELFEKLQAEAEAFDA